MRAPLIIERFLDSETCRLVRRAMDAGAPESAEVLDESVQLDARVRRASLIEVDERTLRLIESLVEAARPRVARHFDARLGEREGVSLVRYPAGGFFKRHKDRGVVTSWPPAARRQIAVVVFLNSCRTVEATGDFTGGVLRLFVDDEETRQEVYAEAGTLIAFSADTLHEVTRVDDGVRDAAVDWFY
jgi:predicted 2-oxoglutarate/Fe(II)-dependent dioxygenase YbiX